MNWTVNDIRNRPLQWYEKVSNSRKLNCYNVFYYSFMVEFSSMDEREKMNVIRQALTPDIIPEWQTSTDFDIAWAIVPKMWSAISADQSIKRAWKYRCKKLNDRPVRNIITQLPDTLSNNSLAALTTECLTEDIVPFTIVMKTSLLFEPRRNMYAKKKQLPFPITVGNQVYREFTMSSLLKKALFGRSREKLMETELVSAPGSDPFIYHVASRARLQQIFQLRDSTGSPTHLTQLVHGSEGFVHNLCSMGTLRNNRNEATACYGIEEDAGHITWMYNDEDNNIQVAIKTVRICRPTAVKNENERTIGYNCPSEYVNGLTLSAYFPACIYLSNKNKINVKMLCARVCTNPASDTIVRSFCSSRS